MPGNAPTRRAVLGGIAALAAGPALPAETSSGDAQLRRLFETSDEAALARTPLNALARGDKRFAREFGDYISDAYFESERLAARHDLSDLAAIDRAALSDEYKMAYDAFLWQRRIDLRATDPDLLRLTKVRPLEQVKGLHVLMTQISAGDSWAPFDTFDDYQDNLARLGGFAAYLDAAEARLREGLTLGVTQPRRVMEIVADQLESVATAEVDQNPFYRPLLHFPSTIANRDRQGLRERYVKFLSERLLPAHARLAGFIRTNYLPRARLEPGLSAMLGGDRLYAHLIETYTTTQTSPAQAHALGLAEVERIQAAMDVVRRSVGHQGDLKSFARAMRVDPRFKPKSAEAISARYAAIDASVRSQLPTLFSHLPRAQLEIRPIPADRAATAPNASYSQGPPDGSRPGVFYFNSSDLPSRVTFDAESLFLHEAIPGHHLQNNLAQENLRLPAFLRFDGSAAFGEGWALYAESLGDELGLYRDPYQRYGRLTNEMFRACRLVVDTGLHAFGWSRDQALTYMLERTAYGEAMLSGEIDRYIAYPGQALSYKIGELTIRRLRMAAEHAMGPTFDIRAFHDQVLNTGRLPLAVLSNKIAAWSGAGGYT